MHLVLCGSKLDTVPRRSHGGKPLPLTYSCQHSPGCGCSPLLPGHTMTHVCSHLNLLMYCEIWNDFSGQKKNKIWKYVQECFIPSENQGEVSPWWYYSLSSHLQGLREFPLNICVLFSAKCLIQGEVRLPRFFGLTVPGSNNRALIQEIVLNIQIKFFFVLFPPFTYNYNSSFMLNNNSPLPLWGSSIPQVSVGCSFPQATLVTI